MNRRDLLAAGAALAAGSALPLNADAGEPGVPASKTGPRLVVRRADERGRGRFGGWLDARYTFSFAQYHDAKHMGFRALRVMNEDVIQEAKGFPMHPHKDMEILTYLLEGALEHKDSIGNGGVIVPGEVQRMSAGRGIHHSEFNPSKKEDAHLLQIWLLPTKSGGKPSYAQRKFPYEDRKGVLKLVASAGGEKGSISIGTDANLYSALLKPEQAVTYPNPPGRHVWIQVAAGSLTVNDLTLRQGDGVRTSDPGKLVLTGVSNAEILLFDLA